MDTKANIHVLNGTEEEQEAEALRRGLVRIPPEEADAVNAMDEHQRREWLTKKLARGGDGLTLNARRRLRNQMKARRRAQRDARKKNRR